MNIPFSTRLQVAKQAVVGLFNDQALSQAEGLLAGVLGSGGLPPTRGTREHLTSYTTMPWVRAIAGKIAYAFASTEWQLFVVQRNSRAIRQRRIQHNPKQYLRQKALKAAEQVGELVEIEEHPLLDSLAKANSYQTGLGLRKLMMLYIDLVGECFLFKERNAVGGTIGLWPIPPHWIVRTPSPTNPVYEVSYRGWVRTLDDVDVLWINDPDPLNPYGRGVGHSQSVADELETDEYAAKMIKQVFFNRARPDLLISPKEGTLLPDEVDRLERGWTSKLQGFHRVLKPFFVRKGVDVKEFKNNFRDLQMKDLREQQRDIVMQVFGIPPEIMGVLTSSNRATIESADFLFTKYVVVPRLEFFREQLQEKLVPEYDDRLILEYISPVQEDKEMQLKAMQAAPWAPNVDEWRAVQGLPELDDDKGKVHPKPFNLDFVEDLFDEEAQNAPPAVPPMVPPPAGQEQPDSEDPDDEDGVVDGDEDKAVWRQRRLARLSTAELRELRRMVAKVEAA